MVVPKAISIESADRRKGSALNSPSNKTSQKAAKAAKKPYQAPCLRIYGDIRALTATAGFTSKNNDHGHGNTKTS
jgi:hypothetical protein